MVESYINLLNTSKIFAGCIMLLMNLGGRYIANEIPDNVQKIFNHPWIRRLIIFSIFFFATRDIKISLLLTLIFVLLFAFLLDEKSKFCLWGQNNEPRISQQEAVEAYETLKKYKKQNQA